MRSTANLVLSLGLCTHGRGRLGSQTPRCSRFARAGYQHQPAAVRSRACFRLLGQVLVHLQPSKAGAVQLACCPCIRLSPTSH